MDPVYEDLDRLYDKEEYLSYLRDEDLEENTIKSTKQAVQILKEQLTNSSNQSYDFIVRSLNVILKDYGFDEELDEADIKMTFDFEVENKLRKQTNVSKDDSKRMLKWVRDIEHEIYGEDTIDGFSIDSSISSLCWNLGFNRPSNRNINIRRK